MINKSTEAEKIISIAKVRMRLKSPFFATLALYTEFKPTDTFETAATDGKSIFYNPDYLMSLSQNQVDGLIIHEILHAALLHNIRRQHRDPYYWNIAADIVVNGLIVAEGDKYELPPGGIRYPDWETKSVEEIYELLLQHKNNYQFKLSMADLLTPSDNQTDSASGSISIHQEADLRAYWQNALQQALVVTRTTGKGNLPAGIERQIKELADAQVDWRIYLWRYLIHTPTDFQGFDRRFVGGGLYLDILEGESIQVFVAIDTSGSISDRQMNSFCSELQGILRSYPHINCQLYYADADIYGPYELKANDSIPKPVGGGGTCFIPFFTAVEKARDFSLEGVCIYLTDGYGNFPEAKPSLPVLWVVVPGGLAESEFPFGEVVKLLDSY
jgi:predicted metal-dependent peptidase